MLVRRQHIRAQIYACDVEFLKHFFGAIQEIAMTMWLRLHPEDEAATEPAPRGQVSRFERVGGLRV